MLDFFTNTTLFNVVSFTIAILGILLALFYGKRFKKPVYNIKSITLVNSNSKILPEITILYKGHQIKNLTYTQVAFWNAGNDVINNTDVAISEPIQATIDDKYEFLDAEIMYEAKKANNFSLVITPDKKHIRINFEYMAKDEGITFKLYHTGNSYKDVKIEGTVKGVDKIEDYDFISSFNSGAIMAQMLFIALGGRKNKIWRIILNIIMIPIWIIFPFFERDSLKYKTCIN